MSNQIRDALNTTYASVKMRQDAKERIAKEMGRRGKMPLFKRVYILAMAVCAVLVLALVYGAPLFEQGAASGNSQVSVLPDATVARTDNVIKVSRIIYADSTLENSVAVDLVPPEKGGLSLDTCVHYDGEVELKQMLNDPVYADCLFFVALYPVYIDEIYLKDYWDTGMIGGKTQFEWNEIAYESEMQANDILAGFINSGGGYIEYFDMQDSGERRIIDPNGDYPWLENYHTALPADLTQEWFALMETYYGAIDMVNEFYAEYQTQLFEAEAERLKQCGINAQIYVYDEQGFTIYLTATLSKEQILGFPYSDDIAYFVRLAPKQEKRD